MPLKIHIPKGEMYDEEKEIFVEIDKEYDLILEHSLISISNWESKWHVPYLKENYEKTTEQAIDYIKCMTVYPKDVPDEVYSLIPASEVKRITEYIQDPMTATTFSNINSNKGKRNKETLSAELLYYYMFEAGIPKECEKWHLNRLMTLINIYGIKRDQQNPNKKLSRSEQMARFREINERNKKKFNTRG